MLVVALSSCSNTKVQSSENSTSNGKDSIEIRLAEKLEGEWYNATYFEVLAKKKDYLEAFADVDLTFFLRIYKADLLSDAPKIEWYGFDEGGDDFVVNYDTSKKAFTIVNGKENADVFFTIEETNSNDSFYCVINKSEKYLFVRKDYETREEFTNKYYKAIIVGEFFVKGDTINKVSFNTDRSVKGFNSRYNYYDLNIGSADGYHKCISLHENKEYDFKGEFFEYKSYKDSVVLKRVDENLKPLDSTLVLYSTNLKPQ